MGWILLTTTDTTSATPKSRIKGPTFAPKQNAGISWKNRRILAERKAAAARSNSVGVGSYKPNYLAVEKRTAKAVPLFEREAAARRKEKERIDRNANLIMKRAEEISADVARGEYLSTQLPQDWVAKPSSKPTFSYKEPTPLPRQAIEKKKLDAMAEAARDTALMVSGATSPVLFWVETRTFFRIVHP